MDRNLACPEQADTNSQAIACGTDKPSQHSNELGEKPSYCNTASGLLRYLNDRIDSQMYTMPDAELEWFSSALDDAMLMAGNLGQTIGQIASLVGFEVHGDGLRSGAFQPHGIDNLLNHASETALIVERMTEIAGTAGWALRDRWEQRARNLGFKHVDAEEKDNG